MLNKLRTHFVSGLLVLAPLFLTVIFFGYLVRLTDRLIVNPIFKTLPIQGDEVLKVFLAKILIGCFVIIFLTLVGTLAEKFFVKRLFSAWEGLLKNIPLLSVVYTSVKEIAAAFNSDRKGVFKEVVYLEYPRKGIYAMGFLTLDKKWDIHEKTGKDTVNVFVPSPPNPATGFFIFVQREEIIHSGLTIEEGIRMVISGGAVVPPLKK
jgi:uncharacterized membrane protein